MASREEIAADDAAVEDIRAKFGDPEASKLAADLYKLRRNPPAASTFAGFPRWMVVLIVLWVAALETADKLPRLLLSYPTYEATLAEIDVKKMQPDLTKAQLQKAQNEATASELQPDLTKAQLQRAQNEGKASEWAPQKAQNEAKASDVQPDMSKAQLLKAQNEAKASNFQPDLTKAQLDKLQFEIKAARWQPYLTAAQAFHAQSNFVTVSSDPGMKNLREQGNITLYDLRPR